MTKLSRTLAAAALALVGVAAQAQVAGVYNGTTSDGLSMQITIADDGNGGLVFTGDSFQWNMTCAKSGTTYFGWWGVGQYTQVTGRTLTVENDIPYLYEKVSMKFSTDSQTVTGSFVGDEPIYIDVTTSKKVENCAGKKVTFTATLGAPAAAVAAPAGARMKHVD